MYCAVFFTAGKGKALYSGDLRFAQRDADGNLMITNNVDAKKRHVLQVLFHCSGASLSPCLFFQICFKDRVLRLGTQSVTDPVHASDAVALQMWMDAILRRARGPLDCGPRVRAAEPCALPAAVAAANPVLCSLHAPQAPRLLDGGDGPR